MSFSYFWFLCLCLSYTIDLKSCGEICGNFDGDCNDSVDYFWWRAVFPMLFLKACNRMRSFNHWCLLKFYWVFSLSKSFPCLITNSQNILLFLGYCRMDCILMFSFNLCYLLIGSPSFLFYVFFSPAIKEFTKWKSFLM